MNVSAVVKQALARINGLYGLGLGLGLGIGVVGWGEPAEGDNAVAISGVNTVITASSGRGSKEGDVLS